MVSRSRASIRVDRRSLNRVKTKLAPRTVRRLENDMMEEIGSTLESELSKVVQEEFPNSRNLTRAVTHSYNRRSGILRIGFDPTGIIDQSTGRPLSEYIAPIMISPRDNRTNIRTNPTSQPLVARTTEGGMFVSQVVRKRLLPYVREQGYIGPEAMAVAIGLAEKIQSKGIRRRAVFQKIFNIGSGSRAFLESFKPRVKPRITQSIEKFKDLVRKGKLR